jgi:4-hydroxy-tetrahydrodipicolinate reductase
MRKFRVVQWATGVVGTSALRGVLRHPRLELVGVKVYSEAKERRDAGELCGAPKTGVVATRDVDAILALDADCVLYCPMPWDTAEICRLLERGLHVVTPCPYWFPFVQSPDVAAAITAACHRGGVNFHASGCNPGGIADRFPLTFSGWCNRIDRIQMTECGDCTAYSSAGVMRELMNLGKTPEGARSNPLVPMLAKSWNEPIDMIAAGLGTRVVRYAAKHDFILAREPIETAVGVIEPGTIALNHYRHIGVTSGGTEIVQEQIWFVGGPEQTKLERKMAIPRESGWRISLAGDVDLDIDIDFPPGLTHDQRVAQGLSTTAFHLVNAVPLVCEAPEPGMKTYLDLPMITGCLGTDAIERS